MAEELLFCSGKHYRKSHEENTSGFKERGINQDYAGKQQIEIGACQLRHVFLVLSTRLKDFEYMKKPQVRVCN